MVVHYPRERLRYKSERPSAVRDVLVEASPRSYRTADVSLGVPTVSARTRRGLWALYASGDQVVVAHPERRRRWAAGEGRVDAGRPAQRQWSWLLARQAVRAMKMLHGDATTAQLPGPSLVAAGRLPDQRAR